MEDQNPQDLTSPHITRVPSAASTGTMEIISDSWFEGKDQMDSGGGGGGWGPPIIHRKENAWEQEKEPVRVNPYKRLQTEKWVDTAAPAGSKPKTKESSHPVSQGTQDFLASLVDNMRDGGNSNTTVMSLLNKPVSVFEEQELVPSRDIDLTAQENINKELEGFLQQIREIRDGPPKQSIEGPVATEIEAHLTVQKTAVEEALAALDRELTQDSGVNSSEAEHEEEFKRIITRESTMTSQGSAQQSTLDLISESDQITRSNSQCTVTTQQTDPGRAEDSTPDLQPQKLTKMGLYELLALHPDAKVRKAALKMKQLDKHLRLVIQREKEVKKRHELFNKQILLYNSGSQLIQNNELQDDGGDDLTLISDLKGDVTPIFFATQLLDGESDTSSLPPISSTDSVTSRTNSTKTTPRDKSRNKSRDQSRGGQSRGMKGRGSAQSKKSNFSRKEDRKNANNKNFIARNKELANDALAAIAMTEEEKQRLSEILSDLDTVTEEQTENVVAIADDGGFRASLEEDKRLREIESLLIVEEGSSMSVCSGQTTSTLLSIQSIAVSELNSKCGEGEPAKLGETALKSLSEKRTEEERLNLIDEMLAKLTGQDEEELPEVPKSVLDELLSQCRAESSRQGSEETVSVS
ncbi:fibrous sheath-interacting protein 1-like isoform X2 [Bolinopsis microptera]|uniref:fibrous sheath-interacting protein 1-like isoform X2 n=1 Tax=Bolinopsis microptera TaxID=2820187 RepID=UPI00307953C5